MTSTTSGGDLRVGPIDEPDRYWLIAEQGRGGEAVLYRGAVHVETAGEPFPVAIKMLLDADDATVDSVAARWRDQKEILHQLGAPGIVRVRDVFVGVPPHYEGETPPEGRRLYLVMDWVEGESLADWLDANPQSTPRQRLRFVAQLAGVVELLGSGATTGRPIVHGDIKPDNIIITADGPVLVDFGLARGEGARPPSRSGTAGYRAPEVDRDGEWSPASDRYALGAVGYFLLTGENPPAVYSYESMQAKLQSRGDVPAETAAQVLEMLVEDPAARPASATAWASSLRAVLSTELPDATQVLPPVVVPAGTAAPSRPRRGRLVAIIVALVLVLGGVGAFAMSSGGGKNAAAPPPSTTTVPVETTTQVTLPPTVLMPSVVGQSVDAAKASLAAAGWNTDPIIEQQADDTAATGTVLSQVPDPESEITGSVTLTVSSGAPIAMQDLTHKSVESAKKLLADQGVTPTVVLRDDLGPPGIVLEQVPSPDETVSGAVTLTVSRTPESAWLSDFNTIGGYPLEKGVTRVNGVVFTDAVRQGVSNNNGPNNRVITTYTLSKSYKWLRGCIGLDDAFQGPATSSVRFEVIADQDTSNPVRTWTVRRGDSVPINVDVSSVIQLTLRLTDLTPDGNSGTAVWNVKVFSGASNAVC
jgi:serine/threonine protein kinase